jgi:hypothetical protein
MRKWILAFALAAVGLSATEAQAQLFWKRPPNAPMSNITTNPYPPKYWRGGQTLPVFQAAPWYLYWPYDAHFQTPAPVFGAYYAPPIGGAFPVQPYFPAPAAYPPLTGGGAAPITGGGTPVPPVYIPPTKE